MIPSLIILGALIVTGTLLWLHHRLTGGDRPVEDAASAKTEEERPDGCCGQHAVCEKLADAALSENDYFDDDELDVYAGKGADEYTAEETDEFREVMLTLPEGEAATWSKALERRNINLPAELRDELLMLISNP